MKKKLSTKSFLSPLWKYHVRFYLLMSIIFIVVIHLLLTPNIYDKLCSSFWEEMNPCKKLTTIYYLLFGQVIFLLFFWKNIFWFNERAQKEYQAWWEVYLNRILFFYIILLLLLVFYKDIPYHSFLIANFYDISLFWAYWILVVILLLALLIPSLSWEKSFWLSYQDEFQRKIIENINRVMPDILTDIAYQCFPNLSFNPEWEKYVKAMVIKGIAFTSSDEVFVHIHMIPTFMANIDTISKFDWTLAIEARWNILNFISSKWKSKAWQNGLVIKIIDNKIDLWEVYSYPYLKESSILLNHSLDVCIWMSNKWEEVVVNLAPLPHMLIAWETWGWKSVAMNCIILSLMKNIISWRNVEISVIDPKKVDFIAYRWLPHLNIIDNIEDGIQYLHYLYSETMRRYEIFKKMKFKNIENYIDNEWPMPYIVLVIDEFADIMLREKKQARETEELIARLAWIWRAAWIHLVLATQNPISTVITSIIKANLPATLWLRTRDAIRSRIVIQDDVLSKIEYKWEAYFYSANKQDHLKVFYVGENEIKDFISYYKKSLWVEEEELLLEWPEKNKNILPVSELLNAYCEEMENDGKKISTFTPSYNLLKYFLENNWFKSRSDLMKYARHHWIKQGEVRDVVSSLKKNNIITYLSDKKINILTTPLDDYTIEDIAKMYFVLIDTLPEENQMELWT